MPFGILFTKTKAFLLLLFMISFTPLSISQKANDTCCVSNIREQGIQNASVLSLSKEFKRLKSLENSCCHKWNSDLHQIMSKLAILLGKEGTSITEVNKYMGKPNANEKTLPEGAVKIQKGEKLLVYTWRGYHDFVYFVYKNNKIKYADWFMWGE
jgi:hypothetical protein